MDAGSVSKIDFPKIDVPKIDFPKIEKHIFSMIWRVKAQCGQIHNHEGMDIMPWLSPLQLYLHDKQT
jgi:hypothetical protein